MMDYQRMQDELFYANMEHTGEDMIKVSQYDPEDVDKAIRRVTSDSPALKFDSDKHSRPELIAPELIDALGVVLSYGAKKYADRNWEKGMAWHRPFGALMRHMWAWWKREDYDAETGYSHLWHAACCLMFLIAYETRNVGEDTRWKRGSDG